MKAQSKNAWIDETAKQVAMNIASSNGKITREEIQNKAEELVQERMRG